MVFFVVFWCLVIMIFVFGWIIMFIGWSSWLVGLLWWLLWWYWWWFILIYRCGLFLVYWLWLCCWVLCGCGLWCVVFWWRFYLIVIVVVRMIWFKFGLWFIIVGYFCCGDWWLKMVFLLRWWMLINVWLWFWFVYLDGVNLSFFLNFDLMFEVFIYIWN